MDELKVLPYDGKGHQVEVTKPVNYPQLAKELVAVIPDGVSFVATHAASADSVSADAPLTIHFSSEEPDLRKVNAVIKKHVPDDNHGLTDDQVKLNELLAKLAQQDLSLADVSALLRLHFQHRLG